LVFQSPWLVVVETLARKATLVRRDLPVHRERRGFKAQPDRKEHKVRRGPREPKVKRARREIRARLISALYKLTVP
jgi:hypothetical protein